MLCRVLETLEIQGLHKLSDTICIENGYSIVADPKRHGQAYNKWLGDRAKLPQREAIRILIDDALAQKPADLDALLALLKAAGCEVKRGKQISIRGPGQTRFIIVIKFIVNVVPLFIFLIIAP